MFPRISCHAALDKAAYALFREERRTDSTNAMKFHRKSGGSPSKAFTRIAKAFRCRNSQKIG